jgi:hypothetical protein
MTRIESEKPVFQLAAAGRNERPTEKQSYDSTDLDTAIKSLRRKIADTPHWGKDDTGNYGRETYYVQLIPLLLAKGGSKSDAYDLTCRQEAAYACNALMDINGQITTNNPIAVYNRSITGTIADYFKSVAKVNFAEALLMDVNDGVCKDLEAEKKYLNTAETNANAGASELLAYPEGKVNFYDYFHAKSTIAKVKLERRGGNDSDASIQSACDEIINLRVQGADHSADDLAGTMIFEGRSADLDRQEAAVGLRSLVNSARLVKLSLALSSQDTAEIQAAVSHLKGVIKDFESLEKEIDHVPGYRDRLKALARPTPTQNFDYFSAKSLLADLELKHVNLTGQPVEGASVKDITDIYGAVYSPKDITGNKADFFGNFPKYFEALSKIGQINYAISIDKLKDLYKAKTRSEAVTAAIKDLHGSEP